MNFFDKDSRVDKSTSLVSFGTCPEYPARGNVSDNIPPTQKKKKEKRKII